MGHVGDELGFQPLALQPLLHRPGHALADGVEILGVVLQVPAHLFRVDLGVQVSVRQGLAAFLEKLELPGEPGRGDDHGGVEYQHDQEEEPAVIGFIEEDGKEKLDEEHAGRQKDAPPGEGEDAHQVRRRPPQPLPHQPAPAQQPPAQGVAPPAPQLQPGGQAHEHGQSQNEAAQDAEAGQRHHQVGHFRQVIQAGCYGEAYQEQAAAHHRQIQVQRDPVLPVGDDALPVPPVPRGAEEKGKAPQGQQAEHDGQHGQRRRGDPPVQVIDRPQGGKGAAGGQIIGQIAYHGAVVRRYHGLDPLVQVVQPIAVGKIEPALPGGAAGNLPRLGQKTALRRVPVVDGVDEATVHAVQPVGVVAVGKGVIGVMHGALRRLHTQLVAEEGGGRGKTAGFQRRARHSVDCADQARRQQQDGRQLGPQAAPNITPHGTPSISAPRRRRRTAPPESPPGPPDTEMLFSSYTPPVRKRQLPASILYPRPHTTFRYRGSEGLISSFSRRWRICTATAPSEPMAFSFQTCS